MLPNFIKTMTDDVRPQQILISPCERKPIETKLIPLKESLFTSVSHLLILSPQEAADEAEFLLYLSVRGVVAPGELFVVAVGQSQVPYLWDKAMHFNDFNVELSILEVCLGLNRGSPSKAQPDAEVWGSS